jgi:hypothetical protein
VSAAEMVRYLRDLDERELRAIGLAAQARVLAAHTSQQRAVEFEREVEAARRRRVTPMDSEAVG